MPRGIYKRKRTKIPHDPQVEVFDLAKGGFIDLEAANKEIARLKDQIAGLNKVNLMLQDQDLDNSKEVARWIAVVDALLVRNGAESHPRTSSL